ncbi:phosphotransferase [Microbacterium sp. NIBRBAC000506063]|uniref:phosphotransferase n=1 Tax=Microbacterium sp. NIBRBAC000506063 TaxID=2734618 RepID=UPI001BB7AFA7|nr:phosphotransferase [Microbacterium sp. NIBRBAC000506063]QTV79770.1 phosphotransferase [Microbacterium sp. NIBRBAC000506063]
MAKPAALTGRGDLPRRLRAVQPARGRGRLSGVIDVDFAGPGPRLWDLSYLAYRMAPYAEDAAGFDPARHGEREERLATLVAAYGIRYSPSSVREAIVERLDWLAEFTEARAAETGRADLSAHAETYRRDAARVIGSSPTWSE